MGLLVGVRHVLDGRCATLCSFERLFGWGRESKFFDRGS